METNLITQPTESSALTTKSKGIERVCIGHDQALQIPRVVTGLWQVADMERGDGPIDVDKGADALMEYVREGFTAFDMADHYGSAELLAGRMLARVSASRKKSPHGPPVHVFTKWCPKPLKGGVMPMQVVRAGIQRSLDRLGVKRIDLLQFHWWDFSNPGYLTAAQHLMTLRKEGLIGHVGLTNFDTDHLRVLVSSGIEIVSNQVCVSVLDARALGRMAAFCREHEIALLAYGTLGGGLLTDRFVGVTEPTMAKEGDAPVPESAVSSTRHVADWSKLKYMRFVNAVGGWAALQRVLKCLRRIADKHTTSSISTPTTTTTTTTTTTPPISTTTTITVANIALAWVLAQPAITAAIVGVRLGQAQHRQSNQAALGVRLDSKDLSAISAVMEGLTPVHGDCGDEYRRPPFLTASGDLSHHLDDIDAKAPVFRSTPVPSRPHCARVFSGTSFERTAGYCRATRTGPHIFVSGTTAVHGDGFMVGSGADGKSKVADPAAQTVYILDKVTAALKALGATLKDVVRTRIFLPHAARDWRAVSGVHGRYFAQQHDTFPANTLLGVSTLVSAGTALVEIEADACVLENDETPKHKTESTS